MIISKGDKVVLKSSIDEKNDIISEDLRGYLGKVVTINEIYGFDGVFKVDEFKGLVPKRFIDYKPTKEVTRKIDSDYTREVVCPYCGEEFLDSWEYEDEGIEYCENCDKEFTYQRDVIVSYSSQKMEQ